MSSSLNKQDFGVIAAVKAEVQDILANPFFQWTETKQHYFHSPLGLDLLVCGIGKANASFALGKIIDKVNEVLIIGTSGGLNNEKIGSLYLSTEFVEHDMAADGLGTPPGVTPFSEMKGPIISSPATKTIARIKSICQAQAIELFEGRTISGDQFLNDPVVTAKKQKQFSAQLVDMESAAIAKICSREKVAVTALRYVTDNANHEAHSSWLENVQISSRIMNKILTAMFNKS